MTEPPSSYVFPPFELDLRSGALYRDGEKINLRPKTYDTLVYLLENQGRLVPKEELIRRIWKDAFVTDDVLVQSVADIRRALGDDARRPRFVQTVPRRGYVFIHTLTPKRLEQRPAEPAAVPPSQPRRRTWVRVALAVAVSIALLAAGFLVLRPRESATGEGSAKPALALAPFRLQSDDPGFAWLQEGLPTLLHTGLSHWPEVPVLGYRRLLEAGAEAGENLQAEERTLAAAEELGAEHVVLGSCVKLGSDYQITARVVELPGREEIARLTERADSPKAIFAAVDRLSLSILQSLAVRKGLHAVEGPLLADSTTRSLQAYQHYLAGVEHFRQGGRSGALQAEMELTSAIQIDPGFAMAHATLAQVQQSAQSWGFRNVDPGQTLRQALVPEDLPERERLLYQGMRQWLVEEDSSGALQLLGQLEDRFPAFAAEARVTAVVMEVLLESGRHREAIRYGERMLKNHYLTNEAKARVAAGLSSACRELGQLEEAVRHGRASVELWPLREGQTYLLNLVELGRTYLAAGKRQEALECFAQVRDMGGQDAAHLTNAGWGLYMAGQIEEALRLSERARRLDPGYGNAQHLAGWLALAGGRYAEAAESLQQAFEETPLQFGSTRQGLLLGDLPALYYAAVAEQKAGRTERARQRFLQLVELCRRLRGPGPPSKLGEFSLQQVLVLEALALYRMGEAGQADPLFAEIVASSQDLAAGHVQLARLAAVAGKRRESLEWLRRGLDGGATEFQHLYDNPDFDAVRGVPEFAKLLQHP